MASAILVLLLNTLLIVSTYAASVYPTTEWAFTEGKATEPSTILTNSLQSPLDAVKFDFINGTSYQWWYFDVVSYDLLSAIAITFNIGSNVGSSNPSEVPTYISVDGKLPNGKLFSISAIPATNIIVNTNGQGSSSLWEGSGSTISWDGTPDLSVYKVTIAAPEYGIQGSITINSVSPAQYPDYLASQQSYNVSELVAPNYGWANAIPGAQGIVDMTVNNSQLTFQGSGYHDTDWGTIPLQDFLEIEYWGHAQVGDLTVVFWVTQLQSQDTSSQIYIADGPTPLVLGNVTVTPVTEGNYPNGTILISTDTGFAGRYEFTLSPETPIETIGSEYTRWIGVIEGGLVGEENSTGVALWEHFDFTT